jgi:pimeloyl-ACP methyl ester carboxylesterase
LHRSNHLVLLPGLDGTDVFFRPLMKALPTSLRPLAICYPPDWPHRYDELLEKIRLAVAHLSDFYVLGSSFSGPLAVLLAAAEPARVRGVILAAAFVTPPRPRLRCFKFAAVGPVVGALRAMRRLPVWLFRSRSDAFRVAKAESWLRVSARCLAARVRTALDANVTNELRGCPQPLSVIAFEDDDVISRSAVEVLQCLRPSARVLMLPGRHLGIWWHAEQIAREITSFVADCESA